ncbi:DoxX family protein [Marivita sp.]|uniref:DoxX family protein n=1 Tax=Marivita sp. TaxID=2003365 RepID=UPI0025C27E9E|nr:DoxX family protein [Marivita sp.]
MTYISLGLRILLTVAFVGAGGAKLAGVAMMVTTFDQIGFGQAFRYFTGAVEVIGATLLWLPRRQIIGAAVLGGTMVGAVLAHLFILGPSPLPAIVLGLLCALVLYIYRAQIPQVLGRTNTPRT